jgi:hypothetical protein
MERAETVATGLDAVGEPRPRLRSAVPDVPSTVPARRGLENETSGLTRKHLARRVRRGEPRADG